METKEQKKNQCDTLIKIVNATFNCSVLSESRKRENINGRMAFATVMRSKGYTLQRIGDAINKDHATILHYEKNMKHFLKSDNSLREKYNLVEQIFVGEYDPSWDLSKEELINELILLHNQKKELHLEIDRLSSVRNGAARVKELVDIVTQRTPLGSEEDTAIKLNIWYNGIYN
jgi:hypothetical protein